MNSSAAATSSKRASIVRVLGVDPGLQVTGYGVVDFESLRPRLVDGGIIRLSRAPLAERLAELSGELIRLIEEFSPDICAVEQLYSHYAHPRTAILMAHARGVILLTAQQAGVRVQEFAANRVKQSVVGHGHAAKRQVQRAIQQLWGLAAIPQPPDVADALAIAVCCGRALRK